MLKVSECSCNVALLTLNRFLPAGLSWKTTLFSLENNVVFTSFTTEFEKLLPHWEILDSHFCLTKLLLVR